VRPGLHLWAAFTVAALATAGCGQAETLTQTVIVEGEPAGPPEDAVFFAHITSLTPAGDGFELQVDPAWFVSGVTATRAKEDDTGDGDVPNDYYIRDESDSPLTYLAPETTRVTVLDDGLEPMSIAISELAQLVAGELPEERGIYDRDNAFGFWVRARGDTVRSLDQQYQP
jgi:hypothetical protein